MPGTEEQVSEVSSEGGSGPRLSLTLRGPNLPGIPDVDVPMNSKAATIFSVVQTLVHAAAFPSRQERLRRIWEPTYTYVTVVLFRFQDFWCGIFYFQFIIISGTDLSGHIFPYHYMSIKKD